MKSLLIHLILFLSILICSCEYLPCRTNCSNNGTIDEECWREALNYRSSELIEQLFSFSSLSVYVSTYQKYHPHELNDSIKFIDESLKNNLLNESINANLSTDLFLPTKQILRDYCQNLTSTPIETVDEFPPLSCSTSTCDSVKLNYISLFIITTIISGLVLIICIVQSFQTRRKSTSKAIVPQNGAYINSLSTITTSVNT